MENRKQTQAFSEMVKHTLFADGADAAFDALERDGWVVPSEQDGRAPTGFRIFATASWGRRVLIRDDDGSLWALALMG